MSSNPGHQSWQGSYPSKEHSQAFVRCLQPEPYPGCRDGACPGILPPLLTRQHLSVQPLRRWRSFRGPIFSCLAIFVLSNMEDWVTAVLVQSTYFFHDDATERVRDEYQRSANGSLSFQRKQKIFAMSKNIALIRCLSKVLGDYRVVPPSENPSLGTFFWQQVCRPENSLVATGSGLLGLVTLLPFPFLARTCAIFMAA